MSEKNTFEKLPVSVVPKHYKIHLLPNLNDFTFKGEVSINIDVKTSTHEIKLHSLDLELNSITLKSENEQYSPTDTKLCTEKEMAVFQFKSALTPGNYTLDIGFSGKLEDNMKGFYRSKHVDEKGTEFYSAVSHFAPTDARRSFPCWDEPAIKATFDVSLTVPKHLMALSNMSILTSKNQGELIKYTFHTSPKMSTYLVAYAVGEFDFVEKISSDGVLIRVYTPLGKKEQGKFALDVATKVLPYCKQYFNIAYPLPKLDLIAVGSLGYSAMENWGLITYRENRVLIDPQNSSNSNKQGVALVVAHELAHQWFGNLVTMKWWTDLWLNEGYATFMQFLNTSALFPEYDVWSQFVNTTFLGALELDSLNSSHPIEVTVNDPSEVNEIFDAITYNKGASVIRMLVHFLGNDTFKEGMSLYLNRYKYGNTTTEDLWKALEEASKQPVSDIMSTWTKQMGFPLIKVDTVHETGDFIVKLSQEKFMSTIRKSPEEFKWMVPISISSSRNPNGEVTKLLLNTKSTEILVPGVKETDWIKINPGVIGFFRTQYSEEMLKKFVNDIKNRTMPPLDRLGLLEDMFALVKAGYTDTVSLLKFLKVYENESDSNVWMTIINILSKLETLIQYTDSSEFFRKFQHNLLLKIYRSVGWRPKSNDTHIDTLFRSKLLDHFGSLKDDDVIKEARLRFDRHVASTELLPANIRSACYNIVVSSGGVAEFQSLIQLYKKTDLNEEKMRISAALGHTTNEELIKALLEFAMSDNVKTQDSVFVLIAAAQTKLGRDLTWNYIKENWNIITQRFTAATLLQNLIKRVTQDFAEESKKKDIQHFFTNKKNSWIERCVQQVLESNDVNIAWIKKDSEAIKKYLSSI
ncbi:puromycin-sensitive aminopeptidase-like isoform X1 [Diabrotica undecimpunctata]|uniref:puromycin-sensitive aminopeptidase-like isoform X1 n=2 Tax=Diabrotica undecimpunctata TaxID=50387 RepID=UPI003B6361E7